MRGKGVMNVRERELQGEGSGQCVLLCNKDVCVRSTAVQILALGPFRPWAVTATCAVWMTVPTGERRPSRL
jgi:hypothetical protein